MMLSEKIAEYPPHVQLKVLESYGLCCLCEHGKLDMEGSQLCTCDIDKLLHWFNPDCTNWIIAEGVSFVMEDETWKF